MVDEIMRVWSIGGIIPRGEDRSTLRKKTVPVEKHILKEIHIQQYENFLCNVYRA
jgi:hypothetical protein